MKNHLVAEPALWRPWLQWALTLKGLEAAGRPEPFYRRALLELRAAIEAELHPPGEKPEEPTVHRSRRETAPVPDPRLDRWRRQMQEMADRWQEPVLIVTAENPGCSGNKQKSPWPILTGVLMSQSDEWDRKNAVETIQPTRPPGE